MSLRQSSDIGDPDCVRGGGGPNCEQFRSEFGAIGRWTDVGPIGIIRPYLEDTAPLSWKVEIMTTPWIFQTPPWMFQTHLADAKIKQYGRRGCVYRELHP
jgi:hypothetical protein